MDQETILETPVPILMDELSTNEKSIEKKETILDNDLLQKIGTRLDKDIHDLLAQSSDDELLSTTFVFSTETM
jgi:hypothetical protein